MATLLIDSERVSDRMPDERMDQELAAALEGADSALLAEVYVYLPADGPPVGAHHEIRNGVLILNRQAVYNVLSSIQSDVIWDRGRTLSPSWPERLPQSVRVAALSHIRRHLRALDDVPIGE